MKKVLSVILRTIAVVVIVAESLLVVYFLYETSNIKEREKDGISTSQGTIDAAMAYNVVKYKKLLYERMGRQLNGTYSGAELEEMYNNPLTLSNSLKSKIAMAEGTSVNAHDIAAFLGGGR